MDEFSLGQADPSGFDLESLLGQSSGPMGPPASLAMPPQQAQAPANGGKSQFADMAPLLAVLPLIFKSHGPVAGAALMRGFMAAKAEHEKTAQAKSQQQFQNNRLTAADQRAADAQQNTEAYRAQMLQGTQDTRNTAFLKQVMEAVNNAETPEGVNALLELYSPQAQQLGIDVGRMKAYATQTATPSKLEQKAAQKYIGSLEKLYGPDWASKVGSATFRLPGAPVDPVTKQPKALTVQELLAKAGTDIQGLPVKPATTDRRGFTTKDITVNGKRMLAGYDPDTNQYYPSGNTTTPLAGDIQEYNKPVQTTSGLPTATMRRVDTKTRTFEGLPVVKNTQKMSEAASFADSLDPNTKNPADDQALIYAFAKAMDPDSVVREGEYATVQKYAQSWAQSFGFNAARVFSNTAFLTPQARQNMKRTIQKKFQAGKSQYDAVRQSYARQINRITGQQDGTEYLTDYGAAFPGDTGGSGGPIGPPVTLSPEQSKRDKLDRR